MLSANGVAQTAPGALIANGDVTIQVATTERSTENKSYRKDSRLFTITTTAVAASSQITKAEASTVRGNPFSCRPGATQTSSAPTPSAMRAAYPVDPKTVQVGGKP